MPPEVETLAVLPGPPTPEDEVLYGRGADARVFVSSQMRGGDGRKVYEDERAQLGDAIDAIPRLKAWLWERDAPVGDYSSESVCVRVAGTSDCLVLAVGRELTLITRKEYAAAQAAKAHCFIFLDSRVEQDADVKAFVKAERERAACTGRFSSSEDLARQAVEQLIRRAVYTLRQGIVSRRHPAAVATVQVEDRGAAWSAPPTQRRYEAQEVAFGDSPEKPETFRTVAEMVAEYREQAESGDEGPAFHAFAELAFQLFENGRADLALEVLDDLRSAVPTGRMSPIEDAWVLNVEALALAQVGKADEADELWLRMLGVGERLGEKHLQATAMQNLANSAIEADDAVTARKYATDSLRLMQELDDTRSMLQLLNCLALIAMQEKDYERAEKELDLYERLAREAQDPWLLTSAHGNRGRLLATQSEFEAAEREFREALKCAREAGSPVSEVLGLQNLGAVCADTNRFGEAMRWYRKGVRLAENFEMPVQAATLRRSLAMVLHHAGRHKDAISEFDRAREISWRLGDQGAWAQATMNMGAVYFVAGDPTAAMEPLEKAAGTFRALGDLESELRVRRNISLARRETGELAAAVEILDGSLALLSIDDHKERAALLRDAAEISLESPDLVPRAIDLFERALVEEEAYLSPVEVARRASIVGSFLSRASAQEARVFFNRSVTELEQLEPDGYNLATALNDRAVGLERLGHHDDAKIDLVRSIGLAEASKDEALTQKALANLSEVERQRGDVPASLAAARTALSLARRLGDDEAMAHAIENLGLALEDDERPDEADAALRELAELAEAQDVAAWKARAARGFGRVAFLRGDFGRAAEHYRAAADICREADSANLVLALGGLLESLGRAGRQDGLQEVAQELVDCVAAGEDPGLIINYLARTGISWLEHRELEEAISLFGVAVLVGARELGDAEPRPEAVENDVWPFGQALCYVAFAAQNSKMFDEEAICEAVVAYVNNQEAGAGDLVRPYLQMAREIMRSRANLEA